MLLQTKSTPYYLLFERILKFVRNLRKVGNYCIELGWLSVKLVVGLVICGYGCNLDMAFILTVQILRDHKMAATRDEKGKLKYLEVIL